MSVIAFFRRQRTVETKTETNHPAVAAKAASTTGTVAGTALPTPSPSPAVVTSATNAAISREFDLAVNPYAGALRGPGRSKRAWAGDFFQRHTNVATNDPIQFELTGGATAAGVVKIIQRDAQGFKNRVKMHPR